MHQFYLNIKIIATKLIMCHQHYLVINCICHLTFYFSNDICSATVFHSWNNCTDVEILLILLITQTVHYQINKLSTVIYFLDLCTIICHLMFYRYFNIHVAIMRSFYTRNNRITCTQFTINIFV